MGYEDAIGYLYGLQAYGTKFGLDNPRALLDAFGNPERRFRSVHVAGTNGKGSTSAMVHSMLGKAGFRAGLFTSPHLVSFTERIRVGDREIGPAQVVGLAEEVRRAAHGLGIDPTFFEVVTVMGFLHFARTGAEWAVVEVGMGGRLDATNTILPEVAVITRIGLDHADYLGATLAEVAQEKAGIIKAGVPVVSERQERDALDVIEGRAGELLHLEGREFEARLAGKGAGWIEVDYGSMSGRSGGGRPMSGLRIPLGGRHQAGNAAAAVRAVELALGERVGASELAVAVREGLRAVRWPGRLELAHEDPPVLLDGAHNPDAVCALVRALREDYLGEGPGGAPRAKLTVVFGAMADKDARGMIAALLPVAGEMIVTATESARAARPGALAALARALGCARVTEAASVREALGAAMARGGAVLVTGSFYMVGAAKEALGAKGFEIGLRE